MQDGASMSGEDASAWLGEHFRGDPDPRVNIQWSVTEEEDGAYQRLLALLFTPRPDSPAA